MIAVTRVVGAIATLVLAMIAPSGGACECRTTACGEADSPQCNGYCAPDHACIFLFTGCSCVSIP